MWSRTCDVCSPSQKWMRTSSASPRTSFTWQWVTTTAIAAEFSLRYTAHNKLKTLASFGQLLRKNLTNTHTYRLMALCPGLPGWAGTRKVQPIWILMKQETVSGSGISWTICKSAPRSRQITTPAPHHSFLQAGCPSCRPTNSVKALKA